MPSTTATAGRKTSRKSPLRVVTELPPITFEEAAGPAAARGGPGRDATGLSAPELRRLMISEYRDWLRSRTNRHGRLFQGDTVSAYADAAIALDAWMTREKIGADFTACGTAILNRFFAAYFAGHGQGGTNTKQRNLRHLSPGCSVTRITPTRTPTARTWPVGAVMSTVHLGSYHLPGISGRPLAAVVLPVTRLRAGYQRLPVMRLLAGSTWPSMQ
jgi:hypothetical protein